MSFRPLIGVNFCKLKDDFKTVNIFNVSVPLSGLTSVNYMYRTLSTNIMERVSVPLSGLTSVNNYHC